MDTSALVEVIDYFRILKAFIIVFFMNVLNQNRKELEEMLVGSNSNPVTTTLRDLHNFKTTLPVLQVLERDPHSSAFLSQRIESIKNVSVG